MIGIDKDFGKEKKKGGKSSVVKEIEKLRKQREERRKNLAEKRREKAQMIARNEELGRNGKKFRK